VRGHMAVSLFALVFGALETGGLCRNLCIVVSLTVRLSR
jgi:hypothetical protein